MKCGENIVMVRKKKRNKKKPAKRKLHGEANEIIAKLMNLKYRLNDAYNLRDMDTKDEKLWVMGQISALREGARLDVHQMKRANEMWEKYNV